MTVVHQIWNLNVFFKMYEYAYANFFFLPDMLILEYPIVKETW